MTAALLQRLLQDALLPTTTFATGTTMALIVESISNDVRYCIMNTLERLLLLLSLILNAYVCILFVQTWKWPQRQQKLMEEEYQLRIKQVLEQHSKTLTGQDRIEKDSLNNDNENEEDICYWRVPKPGKALETKEENGAILDEDDSNDTIDNNIMDDNDDTHQQQRSVPGECVICMHDYAIGDNIAWSSNPDCIHCYHAHCLQEWLIHTGTKWGGGGNGTINIYNHRQQKKLCPCCRQPYYPYDQGSSSCKTLQ